MSSKIVDVVLKRALGKISSPSIRLIRLLLPALVSPEDEKFQARDIFR